MTELNILKEPKKRMLTIAEIAERFPHLSEFQLRKRLKALAEAQLIEEQRADRYNELLYSPNAIDLLRDLTELLAENGNIRKSVQMIVAKAKGEGMAYHLMTKEELIAIIQRQNREIQLLQEKLKELQAKFKPVARKGFWQWIRRLIKGAISNTNGGGGRYQQT